MQHAALPAFARGRRQGEDLAKGVQILQRSNRVRRKLETAKLGDWSATSPSLFHIMCLEEQYAAGLRLLRMRFPHINQHVTASPGALSSAAFPPWRAG